MALRLTSLFDVPLFPPKKPLLTVTNPFLSPQNILAVPWFLFLTVSIVESMGSVILNRFIGCSELHPLSFVYFLLDHCLESLMRVMTPPLLVCFFSINVSTNGSIISGGLFWKGKKALPRCRLTFHLQRSLVFHSVLTADPINRSAKLKSNNNDWNNISPLCCRDQSHEGGFHARYMAYSTSSNVSHFRSFNKS